MRQAFSKLSQTLAAHFDDICWPRFAVWVSKHLVRKEEGLELSRKFQESTLARRPINSCYFTDCTITYNVPSTRPCGWVRSPQVFKLGTHRRFPGLVWVWILKYYQNQRNLSKIKISLTVRANLQPLQIPAGMNCFLSEKFGSKSCILLSVTFDRVLTPFFIKHRAHTIFLFSSCVRGLGIISLK